MAKAKIDSRDAADGSRLPSNACLNCGKVMDAAAHPTADHRPKPGAVAVCGYCGHVMMFDDQLKFRELTDDELVDIAGEPELLAAQKIAAGLRAWKEAKDNPVDLEAMLGVAHAHARRMLIDEKHPSLMPTFAVLEKDESMSIFGCPWTNDIEKRMTLMLIGSTMRSTGALAYCALAEAWMTIVDSRVPFLPPSKSDRRIEVISAMAASRTDKVMQLWEIKRDKKGQIVDLQQIEGETMRGQVGGEFATLLDE
jgi:hypothetical protein